MSRADTKFNIDAPRATSDEAVELCVHHLQLALAYYEAAPSPEQLREEIERKMESDIWSKACVALVDKLELEYASLQG